METKIDQRLHRICDRCQALKNVYPQKRLRRRGGGRICKNAHICNIYIFNYIKILTKPRVLSINTKVLNLNKLK